MAFIKLDHVALVTRDLSKAAKFYKSLGLGLSRTFSVSEKFPEDPNPHRYRAAAVLFPKSTAVLWLMQPTGRSGPLAKFLKERGQGLHHLGFRVRDINADVAKLKRKGISFIREPCEFPADREVRALVDPRQACGVLLELIKRLPRKRG